MIKEPCDKCGKDAYLNQVWLNDENIDMQCRECIEENVLIVWDKDIENYLFKENI